MIKTDNPMKPRILLLLLSLTAVGPILLSSPPRTRPHSQEQQAERYYLGFDRNLYPGDDAMKTLHRDFAFSGYWLSPPPGEKTNTWHDKRPFMRSLGFGFLVLYRGRLDRELKNEAIAEKLGKADAEATAEAAKREGFPANTIVFLDLEEGGRLSSAYHTYILAWLWTLTKLDYQSGFYCSAIPVKDGVQSTITTASDITDFLGSRSKSFSIWAYNDACPPSPGCTFAANPPSPELSGSSAADVWQYAQSPRRKEYTAHCAPGYHADGNCYAPGDAAHSWFLDANSATSSDPSNGR